MAPGTRREGSLPRIILGGRFQQLDMPTKQLFDQSEEFDLLMVRVD